MGWLRHVMMFSGALTTSLVAYHVAAGLGVMDADATTVSGSREISLAEAAFGATYRLSDLRLMDRTSYFISEKYVDPTRVQPEAMFDAALDQVEKKVDCVLLDREPGGRFLHVSVGAYTTTLVLEPIQDLAGLREELRKVAVVIEEHLKAPDVKLPEVEYSLINGMLSTLDPHSILMPPEMSREMDVENQGEFGGLGITITTREGRLTVEYPLEDTPAYRAGIKANDQIVRIEDESTVNMPLDEAVSKLRGPAGKAVNIWIMRDMFEEPRKYTIVRDIIRVNPVSGELLEGGIGYVRIKSFHAATARDLDAVLAGFKRELGGAPKGLILDLRGNPGGFLTQAIEVSNRFLDSGVIVATVGANQARESERASSSDTEPNYPLIVLANASSASASEIVAGALKNLDRAAVVGERSFGKGSVQHLYSNADDSKLKLTVAQYLTSGDHNIQSVGIPPDIELVPDVVQEHGPDDAGEDGDIKATHDPWVSLFWRDRVEREADLDRHLEWQKSTEERPAYRIPYLRDMAADDQERETGKRNLQKDWEVQFAREVLLNAQGSRRADIVAAAAPVVQRRQAEEAEHIRAAFSQLGIDWSQGAVPDQPRLSLALDLGPDGALVAGQEEEISVKVTNSGAVPAFQVVAISKSDNEWLDGNEFYFGLIPPGVTKVFRRHVKLAAGYPTETDRLEFNLRDPAGSDFGQTVELVPCIGQELPRYSWKLKVLDDGSGKSKGDGDGRPEIGEVIDLEITARNVGKAAGLEGFAKLRNEAGHDLDLRNGVVELGGLAPGASMVGRFNFEVRGAGTDGWLDLDLITGDNQLYDYGAVMRGGFYGYVTEKARLRLKVGDQQDAEAMESLAALASNHEPPSLDVTRRPDQRVTRPNVVISGMIRDDFSVQDVIIYHGEDKIFYQGGEGNMTTMPFSIERELKPGLNNFVIIGHDDQGMAVARDVSVYFDATVVAASTP